MANDFYTPTGNPANQSRALAAQVRSELALIAAGFDKLPSPAAIQGGQLNYLVDSGAANAYVVAPDTSVITTLADGLYFQVKIGNANTGAATLTLTGVTGAAAIPIVRYDGTVLQANDMPAGGIVPLIYSATLGKWQLFTAGAVAAASSASAAAASASSASASASQAAASASSAISFRNRIINGGFRINQRAVAGTVTLAAGAYGHDRWKAGAGGCTYTFATSGNVTVLTITAGSLMQVVEDVNVEGGVYSLVNRGTAQARIAVNGAATSGSYAAASSGAPLQSASATGGQTMTVEFSTGTLDRVQLEAGTVATAFERRPIGLELALCQRYYSTGQAGFMGNASAANLTVGQFIKYPASMRASPSVVVAAPSENTNNTGVAANPVAADGFRLWAVSAGVGNSYYTSTYTASAEL